eukprot:4130603-Amphidinium_carterae.1
MPLDVLGSTRATLIPSASPPPCLGGWGNLWKLKCIVIGIDLRISVTINFQRGISNKHVLSARVNYVPTLGTHRPSLLPIE